MTLWKDGVERCAITLQISDPPGSHQHDLLICYDWCAFWSGEGCSPDTNAHPTLKHMNGHSVRARVSGQSAE